MKWPSPIFPLKPNQRHAFQTNHIRLQFFPLKQPIDAKIPIGSTTPTFGITSTTQVSWSNLSTVLPLTSLLPILILVLASTECYAPSPKTFLFSVFCSSLILAGSFLPFSHVFLVHF